MSLVRVAKAFVFLLVVLSAQSARSQVIVYQNASQPENVTGQYSVEYGDEVNLTGNARVLTRLRFEYGGKFSPQQDEKARLRIYANNGPDWKGNSEFPTPRTLLWESPLFPISSGYNLQNVVVPSVRVPDRFTWTVQFFGLSMQTNVVTADPNITTDFAGLLFYGNAEIGFSLNDFWQFMGGTNAWTPVRVPGVSMNNFGVSVTAIPEAVTPQLKASRFGNYMQLSWPRAATGYALQYKRKPSDAWANISAPPSIVGDNYQRLLDFSLGTALFRLKQTNVVAEPTLALTNEGNNVRLTWPANATGYVLQSKYSANLGSWRDESTPAIPSGDHFSALLPRTSEAEIFRLREETKATAIQVIPEGTNLRLRWPSAAKGYRVQSKAPEETTWVDETTPSEPVGNYFEAVVARTSTSKLFRLFQ